MGRESEWECMFDATSTLINMQTSTLLHLMQCGKRVLNGIPLTAIIPMRSESEWECMFWTRNTLSQRVFNAKNSLFGSRKPQNKLCVRSQLHISYMFQLVDFLDLTSHMSKLVYLSFAPSFSNLLQNWQNVFHDILNNTSNPKKSHYEESTLWHDIMEQMVYHNIET